MSEENQLKALKDYVYLLVDDSSMMNQIVVGNLVLLGVSMVNIFTAVNGQDALNVLRKSKVDLVISDFNMPVMNGLDLFKAIKADPTLANTKFMMLTGETEAHMLKQFIAEGVESLLLKPFTSDKFQKRVEQLLSRQGV